MTKAAVTDAQRRLARPGRGVFDPDDLADLPEPVERHLRAAIPAGTPLVESAVVDMRGRLRLGKRWLPFRAVEPLAPHVGFLWAARVAGVVVGSDQYLDGRGRLDWRLFGRFPVAQAEGPDVDRSAAARGAAEGVWVPTALLPRFGVGWEVADDDRLVARYAIDGMEITLRCRVDDRGLLRDVCFDRWGDPDETGTFGWHPFGIDVEENARLGPCTVPVAGVAGWHHGTDRWAEGRFFRFRLTGWRPLTP